MRILFLTPVVAPSTRGNAVTAWRIARGLRDRGHQVVTLVPTDPQVADHLATRSPLDAIVALHAHRCGPRALELAARLDVPAVVVLAGTDVNIDLEHPETCNQVRQVLQGADALVAFHASMVSPVAWWNPAVARRIRIIPQSPWVEDGPGDLRAQIGVGDQAYVALLPGGLRPVKDSLTPVRLLPRLRSLERDVHVVLVGPVLDAPYARAVLDAVATTKGAHYLGERPHSSMAALMRGADLIINSSLSEGGVANSLLEAQFVGRPVLARRIPGNLSLVQEGVTGLTFSDDDEFVRQVERCIADPAIIEGLAREGQSRVLRDFRPEVEAQSYEGLIVEAIQARGPCASPGG